MIMGICYTVYMVDEFFFDYANRSPEDMLNKIKEHFPYSEPMQYGKMIIFDIDKTYPESDDFIEFLYPRDGEYLCDAAYYMGDNNCDMNPIPRPPI